VGHEGLLDDVDSVAHDVVKGFNLVAGTLGAEPMSRQWVRVEKVSRSLREPKVTVRPRATGCAETLDTHEDTPKLRLLNRFTRKPFRPDVTGALK